MGQSLVKNYVHIVFSTKHRLPMIKDPVDKELYAYIAGICKELDCHVLIVGGYLDHIHILVSLSKKIALMTLVQKAKANSSKWIKTKGDNYKNFYWQDGYGAFSVGPKHIDRVIRYIRNQKEHHEKKNFKKEYKSFLENYQVEYDERYLWD